MKKILNIISITALILTACSEDFLQITPEASLTSGNFYKTKAELEQALVGAYAMLRPTKGFNDQTYSMGEMRTDNTHFEFNTTNRGQQYVEREDADEFVDDSQSGLTARMYNSLYNGIARANSVLDNISGVELSQQDEDLLVGQAKFLRALFYFDLVRYFGGVPLYLKLITGTEDAYLQRSPVADVYNAILADLEDAVNRLLVPTFPQNGRATQSSARMLLAEVYMTQKNFPLAENELRSITQMGHDLLPDYASVFDLTNKNSIESIFEVQYQQGNKGQNSNWYQHLPLSGDLSLITGITSLNGSEGNGGYNVATGDLINSYEPNDTRLEASIGIAEGTGPIGNMVIEVVKSPVGYSTPPDKRSYAYIKKFVHAHALQKNTDDNFPVYRYSDALLSLAEALNEQNKSSEALPYLNQVRSRAGLPDVTETAQSLLRDIIAHERRIEFAFENKRWFDLLRTDKAIEVMNAHGDYIKAVHGIEAYLPTGCYNVTTERLLFPIPYRERQIANLEQNPGYED